MQWFHLEKMQSLGKTKK